MEDESLLNKNSQEVQDYLNELAIAVCIRGERLEKYEKIAIKQCGSEAYANMKLFVEEVQRSEERKKFTNTSKINLSYRGKNAGLSDNTVTTIIKHFEDNFAKAEREEIRNQLCAKEDYQQSLNRYYQKIQQAENEEKKLEEQRKEEAERMRLAAIAERERQEAERKRREEEEARKNREAAERRRIEREREEMRQRAEKEKERLEAERRKEEEETARFLAKKKKNKVLGRTILVIMEIILIAVIFNTRGEDDGWGDYIGKFIGWNFPTVFLTEIIFLILGIDHNDVFD